MQKKITERTFTFENWYKITVEEYSHYFSYTVDEATMWDEDDKIVDVAPYLKGSIKWDGCSDWDMTPNNVCLHICGVADLKRHVRLLQYLWVYAQENMEAFDETEKL
jgi:hypothetical protein